MTDKDTLKRCLLEPLPPTLFKNVSMNTVDKSNIHQDDTIENLIHVLISTYNILAKDEERKRKFNQLHSTGPYKSKFYRPSNETFIASPDHTDKSKKWCSFHKNNSHNTDECRILNRKQRNGEKKNYSGNKQANKKKYYPIVPTDTNYRESHNRQDDNDHDNDHNITFAAANFANNPQNN